MKTSTIIATVSIIIPLVFLLWTLMSLNKKILEEKTQSQYEISHIKKVRNVHTEKYIIIPNSLVNIK
jgi:hypothetical protein